MPHKNHILDLSAIILCGGNSGRMGCDKAFADFKGKPLFQYVYSIVKSVSDDIVLVVRDPVKYSSYKGYHIITDDPRTAGKGPLAGIYSGLKVITNNRAFVAACDMPLITGRAIRELAGCYDSLQPRGALLTRCNGQIEPLFSLYNKQSAPFLLKMLLNGQSRVRRVADYIETHYFDITDETVIYNINCPEDLEKARLFSRD